MTSLTSAIRTAALAGVAALLAAAAVTSSAPATAQNRSNPMIGRWDLKIITGDNSSFPSWLEVQLSGRKTLVGYFVGRGGSVRPISKVNFDNGKFKFFLPVQWEDGPEDFRFEGTLTGDKIAGDFIDDKGSSYGFTGVRAPDLIRKEQTQWGPAIELFNGTDLTGWKTRWADRANGWVVENGALSNAKPGNDLLTEQKWHDFKLHAEFRYPQGSNSGVYLRGRYEAQIEDNYGKHPGSHYIGGIYGFLTPRLNAAKPAGEWQTFDLTLVGRRVTVVMNGETVIDRAEIPGITGGALDSDEGEPGPVLLQGDHGKIEFRKLTLTPSLTNR